MLFMAHEVEQIDDALVSTLATHFYKLSEQVFVELPSGFTRLEKTFGSGKAPFGGGFIGLASASRGSLLATDCPPTSFSVPCYRCGRPPAIRPIRSEIRHLSDQWWPLEPTEIVGVAARIRDQAPSLLLDLGGHTADNYPLFLSQRLARVQATYLGFFGPTYGACCDWWIVDSALMAWIASSYPNSEPLWPLPGPSLCYVPSLHGLPEPAAIHYKEPKYPVYGSFNHTRKLTRSTQKRFGAVLAANSDAVLQFRSHSFRDPFVRRYFLQRFRDAGISAHQLQPLPYAQSATEAMSDYGRIHLHLDSTPVSSTTTTLDSLAMGIPVLTCPTRFYAGAISASILQHAGLSDHIFLIRTSCRPMPVGWRIDIAAPVLESIGFQVRQSPICDDR